MTITDADYAIDNASPDTINTAPLAPNSPISTGISAVTTENKTSVRQLLYGQ